MTVSIKMSADARAIETELKRAQDSLRRLTDQLKGLGRESKDFGKIDFGNLPGDADAKNLEKVQRQYRELLALNADLRRRIQLSGQDRVSPLDLDWERMGYLNRRSQEAARRRVLANVLRDTPWQPPAPAPGADPTPNPHEDRAAGPSLFAGLGGGLKMGLGLMGVSSGLALLAQAFRGGKDIAVATDLFIRRTREAGETFDSTRLRLEQLGKDLYLTDQEAARLGIEFASAANEGDPRRATEGARAAVGFGRGYGIDPNVAVQGFGALQFLGATGRGGMSQRQMLLLIGKTISDGMLAGKAEQVISDLGTHVEKFVSQTMRAPDDIAGYLGLRAAMGQLAADPSKNLPGLAAFGGALYQQMTQGLRAGAGGLGSDMLRYRVLGQAGYGPWEIYNMRQSLTPMTPLKDGRTYYEHYLDYAQRSFGGRIDDPADQQRILAMLSADLGQNPQSILAFDAAIRQHRAARQNGADLADWEAELRRAGVDAERLNPTGIKEIGDIFAASVRPDLLREIGARYLQREDLQGQPRARLEQAMAGGEPDKLRRALLAVAGTLGMTQTDGTKIQQSIADLINIINEVIGKKLISAITTLSNLINRLTGVGESIAHFLGIETPVPGELESARTGLKAPLTSWERWKAELNPGNWFKWSPPDWMKKLGPPETTAEQRKADAEAILAGLEARPRDYGPPARVEKLKQEQRRILEDLERETRAAPAARAEYLDPRDALRQRGANRIQNPAQEPAVGGDWLTRTIANARSVLAEQGLDPDLSDIVVAQAAQETGYGAHQPREGDRLSNNFFGMTAGPRWRGETVGGMDNGHHSTCRAYPDERAGMRGCWDFVSRQSRYQAAEDALRRGDREGYVPAIASAGWAEDQGYYAHVMERRREIARRLARSRPAAPPPRPGFDPNPPRAAHQPNTAPPPRPGFDPNLLRTRPRNDGYTPLPPDARPPAEERTSQRLALNDRGQLDIYLHQRDAGGRPVGPPIHHRLNLTQRAPRNAVQVENLWGTA